MGHEEPKCPYVKGNKITFRLTKSCLTQDQVVKGTIVEVFDFTLSCVMAIVPEYPYPKERLILKLYDRRFAAQLRKDKRIQPWTPEIEQKYQQSILDGRASDFITKLRSDDDMVEDEEEPWDAAQNEAYLFDYMQQLYETESEAYETLKDLQGRDIPHFLGCITMPGYYSQSTAVSKYIDSPGILLQYIEGVLLSDLALFAPKSTWQKICEDAIRIVNILGNRGILNKDVKPRNFIVHRESAEESAEESGDSFKIFMIDFALCKFRRQYEDEQEYWESKATQDEEGAVGYIMQSRLKGGFVYHRSAKYLELDKKFKSEMPPT